MLAYLPVSMLNQKTSDYGIPNRFKLDPSRSGEIPRKKAQRRSSKLAHGLSLYVRQPHPINCHGSVDLKESEKKMKEK